MKKAKKIGLFVVLGLFALLIVAYLIATIRGAILLVCGSDSTYALRVYGTSVYVNGYLYVAGLVLRKYACKLRKVWECVCAATFAIVLVAAFATHNFPALSGMLLIIATVGSLISFAFGVIAECRH